MCVRGACPAPLPPAGFLPQGNAVIYEMIWQIADMGDTLKTTFRFIALACLYYRRMREVRLPGLGLIA